MAHGDFAFRTPTNIKKQLAVVFPFNPSDYDSNVNTNVYVSILCNVDDGQADLALHFIV